jgi:CBS domain-containing protein
MDDSAFRREAEQAFGRVEAAMRASVIAFEPGMRASDAALRLAAEGIAGAPVIENDRVIGVISLRDLLEREGHVASQTSGPFLRGERHLAALTVADVMAREVVTVRETDPLTRAIDLMDSCGVNRLPVVDDRERPVGILARDDVIRGLARVLREPVPSNAS